MPKRMAARVAENLPGPLRAALVRYPKTSAAVVAVCAAAPLPILSTLMVATAAGTAAKRVMILLRRR